VELTIVGDSSDTVAAARKGSVRVDQIATFVNVEAQYGQTSIHTKITLLEPDDYMDEAAGEAGGVIRGARTLHVQEPYDVVKSLVSGLLG
jgi:hypothetical protein